MISDVPILWHEPFDSDESIHCIGIISGDLSRKRGLGKNLFRSCVMVRAFLFLPPLPVRRERTEVRAFLPPSNARPCPHPNPLPAYRERGPESAPGRAGPREAHCLRATARI